MNAENFILVEVDNEKYGNSIIYCSITFFISQSSMSAIKTLSSPKEKMSCSVFWNVD